MSGGTHDGPLGKVTDDSASLQAQSGENPDIQEVHITCIERTASALLESEAATSGEIEAAIVQCEQALERGDQFEFLDIIARVQGHEEEFVGEAIHKLAESVGHILAHPPVLVTFTSKLIVPNGFYDVFPEIRKACAQMQCPVVFAEDTDAIGTGSINPIASSMMADHISSVVKQKNGIRPFMTVVRLDYDSWCFLNRKHFAS